MQETVGKVLTDCKGCGHNTHMTIQFTIPLPKMLAAIRSGQVAPVITEYPSGDVIVGVESTHSNGGRREAWGERDIAKFVAELATRGVEVAS